MKKKPIEELRVLVADDIPFFRDTISKILRDMGIARINEAADGLEAWNKIILQAKTKENFDLIISDINMPKMSGIELLKNTRGNELTSKLPFILVSTESEQDIILKAVLLGISDYLIKPYNIKLATKKIQDVLSKKI